MIEQMVQQGLVLMVAGMGTVFVFLFIMIFVMKWASSTIIKYEASHKKPEPKKAPAAPAARKSGEMEQIAACIAIARKHYGLS